MPALADVLARANRALRLLDLLTETGPDAPTLCQGWRTRELAAHLVVRDRQPLAVPGLVVPLLHGVTEAFERRARTRPYDDVLADLRGGPGPLSPGRLGDAGELHEWYVHHEDVRRVVSPGPRAAEPALQDALWSRLALLGPALAARARGLGVVLATPDGRRRRVRRGPAQVVLRGEPAELFLWLFGRRAVARVQVDGGPDAARQVAAARFGL